MVFFKILEVMLILFIILFITTQIILPAVRGRALFPLFRDEGKLWMEDAELEQQQVEEELRQEIVAKREALEQLRNKERKDGIA